MSTRKRRTETATPATVGPNIEVSGMLKVNATS